MVELLRLPLVVIVQMSLISRDCSEPGRALAMRRATTKNMQAASQGENAADATVVSAKEYGEIDHCLTNYAA